MSSGDVNDVEMTFEIAAFVCVGAAGCPGFDDRGQLGHGPGLSRIERRSSAEFVDHTFERLNLGRQLAGGLAIVPVFDLQRPLRRLELVAFEARHSIARRGQSAPETRSPSRADADGAQTDRQAADDATRTVGNHNTCNDEAILL